MAKKIEGYVDGTGEGTEFTPYKEGNQYFPFWEAQGITLKPKFDYWRKAVVVVTDERVFTESEVRASAMAEPELPDEMPDEMWEACKSDRATMQEAMRVVVRLTRDGILGRLLDPA